MHHLGHVGTVGDPFSGYGDRPPWAARLKAMVSRYRYCAHQAEGYEPGGEVTLRWQNRLRFILGWSG